jgi:ketosteroid isomerase-like protein
MRVIYCLIWLTAAFFLVSCTALAPVTPMPTPVPAATPTPSLAPTTAPAQATEELVKEWMVASEALDLMKTVSFYADDVVWEDPAYGDYFTSQEQVEEMYRWLYSLPDVAIDNTTFFISADGRWAAVEWEWSGTNEGEGYSTHGVSILEIEGDKIVHEVIYYDRTW